MKNHKIFVLSILLTVFAGCRTSHMTELQRFERSVLKELPFSVDSISLLTSGDFPTFRFANTEYIGACPDAEIRPDGDYWVCNMFDAERPQRYGTQIDGKGNLAPLLDASRVNKWRQEVGLPPIEQFEEGSK